MQIKTKAFLLCLSAFFIPECFVIRRYNVFLTCRKCYLLSKGSSLVFDILLVSTPFHCLDFSFSSVEQVVEVKNWNNGHLILCENEFLH